ncbi:hypothetical protein MLD38_038628 [Melastoma candidum]|uniref:Uncharacterized protein n=1 Tax=Melastoma candidum TaxID=119954 RepID=A0ACB9L065_9MYRT|nr:hypothetical protein MLD38_038628 [Melastoma candidum]
MADKNQQVYPIAPSANGHPRSDEESLVAKEEKRKKMIKWAGYIAAFTVFQVLVIVVFALVVMKVRTPKFRVGDGLQVKALTSEPSVPSFNMTLYAPIRVKNSNFGPYKYDATAVTFTYGGATVGQVAIPKGKASFKSTKKINAEVFLSSGSIPSGIPSGGNLGSDLNSGTLTLNSKGAMTGKVELMLIFKKKKAITMDCTMVINVSSKSVQSVQCQ